MSNEPEYDRINRKTIQKREGETGMPDVTVHAVFGQRVRNALDPTVQAILVDEPYHFALFGPDPWFMHKPWQGRRNARGRRMHTTKTGAFLMALADQCRGQKHPEAMFSYLSGFLCHYALDSAIHPYVYRMTLSKYARPCAHRALEHSMDVCELIRQGFWGEKHPVTDHFFPILRLPKEMEEDLDAVFGKVYGWKNTRRALNRCSRLYRTLYRMMEKPDGIASRMAKMTKKPFWQSVAYAESYLAKKDVENVSHDRWEHSHMKDVFSCKSVSEMEQDALENACEMIGAAYGYIFGQSLTREQLSGIIGNRSYLSGLPVDDPRNMDLPSALPSED